MRFLQKLLTTLVGFVFTIGGFGKASAQEAAPATVGTVVLARENRTPSMNADSYDTQRNRLIVLAQSKDKDDEKKGKGKGNSKNKTRRTKDRTVSPHKPKKGDTNGKGK